ncbi:nitroreductase family protein [Halolactibacillus sp. JCM 19043]|uniref:nitroreductase family protein n=1 Tax=Halolactibacillus sp. JCM 19043 TaxID=1460638 RepID=UPI0012E1A9FB|nr:nitroreductase family protein [Halolactibacillus sp. JCM 19043]
MNQTIDTILNHRSIRKFKPEPLKQEHLALILDAARSSSTSSYLMAYTMIGVTDPEKKSAWLPSQINLTSKIMATSSYSVVTIIATCLRLTKKRKKRWLTTFKVPNTL